MAQKIKKGDTIVVLSGKEKGKTGTVLEVLTHEDRVVVEGVNMITRHTKNRRVRSRGQIIEKPAPLHISNVAVAHNGKPVRVGYDFTGEGAKRTKVRVARPSGTKL